MSLVSNKLVNEGLDNWKHTNVKVCRHEESCLHKKAMILLSRKWKGQRVDAGWCNKWRTNKIIGERHAGPKLPQVRRGASYFLKNHKCCQTIPDEWRLQESLVGEIFRQMGDLGAL